MAGARFSVRRRVRNVYFFKYLISDYEKSHYDLRHRVVSFLLIWGQRITQKFNSVFFFFVITQIGRQTILNEHFRRFCDERTHHKHRS